MLSLSDGHLFLYEIHFVLRIEPFQPFKILPNAKTKTDKSKSKPCYI